ncbi:GntR family transcriptional regulator [Flexivirga oryzae]|uniref:DNA-binding GntR family transcriptional regulator n=1 Tax=Flexivirga oryzae TaxID=1794944 RepID=A0A839N718_9MICO|nr:GntR family transcriptional regulator [Flexivirga oryzae]MBB2891824.1 DNA-binding GntR family transcriptional regulator [Flexivirga oryzae]
MAAATRKLRSGQEAKQLVVQGLRDAILAGDMAPGQRLVESELMETFGATRGSVRSAIDDLAAEGLVERIPNRGARVRRVSLEEAIAILECRAVLEGLLASRAATRATDAQIAQLVELGERMTEAVRGGDVGSYSRLNSQLHETVSELGEQQVATGLIGRLRAQIVRHQFRLSMRPGRPQVSIKEHLAIIRAIEKRDPEAADRAARAHVHSVIDALVEIDREASSNVSA